MEVPRAAREMHGAAPWAQRAVTTKLTPNLVHTDLTESRINAQALLSLWNSARPVGDLAAELCDLDDLDGGECVALPARRAQPPRSPSASAAPS